MGPANWNSRLLIAALLGATELDYTLTRRRAAHRFFAKAACLGWIHGIGP